MSSFAQQLIAGLHEAAAGDFTRFTIQGQVWVRSDRPSINYPKLVPLSQT